MRAVTVLGLLLGLVAVYSAPAYAWSEEPGSISGLWRLAGIMPAGAPWEEIPGGIDERQFYWFHDDGMVSLIMESQESRTRLTGRWKQAGNSVTITWEDGAQSAVRVVKLSENYMILTGLDVRPLWFRFLRYF